MYAVVCVQLSDGHGRHKTKGDPVHCVCRNQDSLESAKMAVTHLLGPESDEKVEFEFLSEDKFDGKTYAILIDNSYPANWLVFVKEILPDDDVTDLRHHYTGTWRRYYLKSSLSKI
ncbi:MAG: hypothetical protein FGM57_02650 [Candidatus Taylorbacteria bacterium]|nr:hypothetical protein [Candidatus Taylorbacteria bacterium]